jgi:hypothetical protein
VGNSDFRPKKTIYIQVLVNYKVECGRILDRISREIYILSAGNAGVFSGRAALLTPTASITPRKIATK